MNEKMRFRRCCIVKAVGEKKGRKLKTSKEKLEAWTRGKL